MVFLNDVLRLMDCIFLQIFWARRNRHSLRYTSGKIFDIYVRNACSKPAYIKCGEHVKFSFFVLFDNSEKAFLHVSVVFPVNKKNINGVEFVFLIPKYVMYLYFLRVNYCVKLSTGFHVDRHELCVLMYYLIFVDFKCFFIFRMIEI